MAQKTTRMHASQPHLLDLVREAIERKHYSRRTEAASVGRIKQQVLFHYQHHLQERGKPEVEALLTDLAFNQRWQYYLNLIQFHWQSRLLFDTTSI